METDAVEVHRGMDRVLELWICRQPDLSRNVPQMKGIPGFWKKRCGKFATGLELGAGLRMRGRGESR